MPEAAPAPRRPHRPGLRRSDDAVSEVVGQLLMFGILSMVLILSLLGFGAAKDGAEGRVASLEAESLAQRVAGVYISASLFAEKHAEDDLQYERRVDLPEGLQQRSYTVSIENEVLSLSIEALGIEVSASLLSSGAPPGLTVCDQTSPPLPGGPLLVKAREYVDPDDATLCPNGAAGDVILFLESA